MKYDEKVCEGFVCEYDIEKGMGGKMKVETEKL